MLDYRAKCRKSGNLPRLFIGLSSIVFALAVVSSTVQAGDTSDSYMKRRGEPEHRTAYETALGFMQKGDCDRAEQILGPILKDEPGNEVAQVDMGYCYLQKASNLADPAETRRLREIGTNWILLAANAGQRRAQQELATQYLEGGSLAVDHQEAGKWFLLWKSNHSNLQVAPSEFDEKLEKKLQGLLTEAEWDGARKRADKWQPTSR